MSGFHSAARARGEEVGSETVAVHPPVHRLDLAGAAPRQVARQALGEVRLDVDLVGLEEGIPEKEDAAAACGRRRRPFAIVKPAAVRGHYPRGALHLASPGNAQVGPPAKTEELVVLQGGLLDGDDPGKEQLRKQQNRGRRRGGDGAIHRQGAQRERNAAGPVRSSPHRHGEPPRYVPGAGPDSPPDGPRIFAPT